MDPWIKLPTDVLGTHSHAQIYSFSGSMLIAKDSILLAGKFTFSGVDCFVGVPFRLGHSSWRPIPQLNDQNVELAFGDKLEGLPLQLAVLQALATTSGPRLNTISGRGNHFSPTLPPDSVILVAQGENLKSVLEDLSSYFIPRLVGWLRVQSKQWWIGQPTERQTGNLHFEFEIGPKGELGPTFAPLCRQTTASLDMRLIDQDIWYNAVSNAAKGIDPTWAEVMRCDISAAYHARDDRMAILLSCCWVELLRDEVLTAAGIRLSQLKTSSTDLLKQMSVGFKTAFGRDISEERKDNFDFLRACWIARGDLAHGRPMSWKMMGAKNFRDLPTDNFHQNLDEIGAWLNGVKSFVSSNRA